MEVTLVDEAIELLEKANADLEPELLSGPAARRLLDAYARAQRLAAYGVAALARKLDDASELSRVTGTSMARAKDTVAVGKVLGSADELSDALQHGDISLDQAAEIAKAEETCPDASKELLAVAQEEAFHVLRDKARKLKLEAEQHNGLAGHQRAARSVPAATGTSSAWCTCTSRWSPTSGPRSWLGPRPRPPAGRAPPIARTLNGVFYDGTDLRQLRRWSRSIPIEVAVALELGPPPSFDGVVCVDCSNRFRTEFDHVQPRVARTTAGPASSSLPNPDALRSSTPSLK